MIAKKKKKKSWKTCIQIPNTHGKSWVWQCAFVTQYLGGSANRRIIGGYCSASLAKHVSSKFRRWVSLQDGLRDIASCHQA